MTLDVQLFSFDYHGNYDHMRLKPYGASPEQSYNRATGSPQGVVMEADSSIKFYSNCCRNDRGFKICAISAPPFLPFPPPPPAPPPLPPPPSPPPPVPPSAVFFNAVSGGCFVKIDAASSSTGHLVSETASIAETAVVTSIGNKQASIGNKQASIGNKQASIGKAGSPWTVGITIFFTRAAEAVERFDVGRRIKARFRPAYATAIALIAGESHSGTEAHAGNASVRIDDAILTELDAASSSAGHLVAETASIVEIPEAASIGKQASISKEPASSAWTSECGKTPTKPSITAGAIWMAEGVRSLSRTIKAVLGLTYATPLGQHGHGTQTPRRTDGTPLVSCVGIMSSGSDATCSLLGSSGTPGAAGPSLGARPAIPRLDPARVYKDSTAVQNCSACDVTRCTGSTLLACPRTTEGSPPGSPQSLFGCPQSLVGLAGDAACSLPVCSGVPGGKHVDPTHGHEVSPRSLLASPRHCLRCSLAGSSCAPVSSALADVLQRRHHSTLSPRRPVLVLRAPLPLPQSPPRLRLRRRSTMMQLAEPRAVAASTRATSALEPMATGSPSQ